MLSVALIAVTALATFFGPTTDVGCTPAQLTAGVCAAASNQGTFVQVGGTEQHPGGSDTDGSSNRGGSGNGGDQSKNGSPDACTISSFCGPLYSVALVEIPDVTLADIASFVPAKPTFTNEPAGLGVVGMPTNFVGSASEQRIPGRLFDHYDVVVRFVPAGFRFDYGDGSSRTSDVGGASWAALGQAEFTPAPTSHVYSARGTYIAGVTVLYTASVQFASGRVQPVAGYVQATTGGYDVRVVEVHTALVDKTCLENPAGPGC